MYAALYVSRATRPLTEADLADILFMARRKNAERGVTGRLVYAAPEGGAGTFVQWLEGEDWRVRELLYGCILRDGRHAIFGVPFEGATTRRVYPSWTMGYERLDDEAAVSKEIETLLRKARALVPEKRSPGASSSPSDEIRLDA